MKKVFQDIQLVRQKAQKAWVVFSGETDFKWLKILKPGFRHCFVLLHDGSHWISVDPLSNHMEVQIHHMPPDFDLPLWLEDRGQTVFPAALCRTKKKAAPLMMFSCVEAVKRILGIHKRFIITPWQLYHYLSTQHAQPVHRGFAQKYTGLCTKISTTITAKAKL